MKDLKYRAFHKLKHNYLTCSLSLELKAIHIYMVNNVKYSIYTLKGTFIMDMLSISIMMSQFSMYPGKNICSYTVVNK